ncbi:hypothetical protein [Agromyces sp. LHK192]|uniref:hypothetical protein n=1 Tax=Agromyces sp. LHK192 TaxID=2498704 RepID=UPI001F0C1EEE|nr:hypothetical protein [Agromyces sp. LHK192]
MSILSARLARRASGARRERTPFRERRLVRGVASTIAAVLLGAGLTVVGAVAPAAAHTGDLKATAVCNAQTGKYDVTYTLELTNVGNNLTGTTKWRVGSSSFQGTPSNANGMDRGPIASQGNVKLTLGTESIPGDTKGNGPWVYAYTKWSDGFGKGSDGRIEGLKGDCGKPFDWNWEYAAPTCEALTVVYPKDIPAGQANDVNIRFKADGKEFTLNFHKNSGTWSGTKTFTYSEHPNWPDPDLYSVVWAQVGGTNYHWSGSIDCGDSVTICHWNGTDYDKLAISIDRYFADDHDSHGRDIHAAFEYVTYEWWDVFKKFPKTKTVPAKGDQSLLQYPDCVKPPTELPPPPAPTFSDLCGPANHQFVEPTDTAELDWTTTYSPTQIVVTVAPKAGYALPPGTTTTWTFPINDAPCPVILEDEPDFLDTCGPDNEQLFVPADTDGVAWTKHESDGFVTVTATAKPGYAFADGTKTEWRFELNDEPCIVPVGGTPSVKDTCGPANEVVTVPADSETVDWEWSKTGSTIVVTATPTAGNAFPEGAQREWTFTVDDGPCIVPVGGEPSFADKCGPDNEQLTVPQDTDTVDWEQSESEGIITVTATAKNGFAFAPDTKREWTFTVNDEPCIIEVGGEPTFSDTCGPDNEQLTVPKDTDTVDWEQSESAGVITVTATAKPGSAFPEGAKDTWTFTVNDSPCIIELEGEPSFTDVCGPENEELTVPTDTDTVDWEQSESEGVITVTATAKPGFAFPEGTTAKWEYAVDDADCIVPTLTGSLATGVCEADVPWITYDVVLNDPDGQSESRLVTLTLSDGTNSEVIELGELTEEGTLTGRTLWPGASVDDEGNATGWPGWEQTADGFWVETDDNFAWTRDVTSAVLAVNPSVAVDLAYPPATPNCATGPGGIGDGSEPAAAPQGGTGLASTGFAGTTIAIVAGVIVIAGIAFLVIARIRRKKA